MTTFTLTGGVEAALTHFAAHGLAEILVEAGVEPVRWGWHDGRPARAEVQTPATTEQIGEAVRTHARRHADESGWVQASEDGRRGALSPRLAAPKSREAWGAHERARTAALDLAQPDHPLDHRFLAALGRPAYWNVDTARPNADSGASRWEMKTRNRGETFIGERLAPLATIVAHRDTQSVVDGLSGAALIDENGKGKPDSRTATGLVSPRPVDNALAWCALWGLSATAVWWRPVGAGASTAVMPVTAIHPTLAALPLFAVPVTPARYRRTLRSAAWASLTAALYESRRSGIDVPAEAAAAVVARGVEACVTFGIHKGGSDSAPERYLEGGRLVGLRSATASRRRG